MLGELSPESVAAGGARRRARRAGAHRGAVGRAARRHQGRDPGGWFAARPSGTEDVCKLYAESFKGDQHLELILEAAQELLERTLTQ